MNTQKKMINQTAIVLIVFGAGLLCSDAVATHYVCPPCTSGTWPYCVPDCSAGEDCCGNDEVCCGGECCDGICCNDECCDWSFFSGCESGGSSSVNFIANKVEEGGLEYACGSTGPIYAPDITIPLPTYSDCEWVFGVTAEFDIPCNVYTHLFTEISSGSSPSITPENLCKIFDDFYREEPVCGPAGNAHGKAECIQLHEDQHFMDANNCLIEAAAEIVLDAVPVDCVSTCFDVRENQRSSIIDQVENAWIAAANAWNSIGETNAIAAARWCWCELVEDIDYVWDARTVCGY
jgi:hypothetical protein